MVYHCNRCREKCKFGHVSIRHPYRHAGICKPTRPCNAPLDPSIGPLNSIGHLAIVSNFPILCLNCDGQPKSHLPLGTDAADMGHVRMIERPALNRIGKVGLRSLVDFPAGEAGSLVTIYSDGHSPLSHALAMLSYLLTPDALMGKTIEYMQARSSQGSVASIISCVRG